MIRQIPEKTRRRNAGLTLFELLVVIAIVGIASTMVVMSLNPAGPDGRVKTEARRLTKLIELAIDESVLTGSHTGFGLTRNGYGFFRQDHETGAWRTLETTGPLRPRALPEEVVLRLADAEGTVLASTPEGVDDEPLRPSVVFLSSGEISPFQLSVIDGRGKEEYRIVGQWDGAVSRKAPGPAGLPPLR